MGRDPNAKHAAGLFFNSPGPVVHYDGTNPGGSPPPGDSSQLKGARTGDDHILLCTKEGFDNGFPSICPMQN